MLLIVVDNLYNHADSLVMDLPSHLTVQRMALLQYFFTEFIFASFTFSLIHLSGNSLRVLGLLFFFPTECTPNSQQYAT